MLKITPFFPVPVHFNINSDENLFLVIDITKNQYFNIDSIINLKTRFVQNIFPHPNIITEYNATFATTQLSGQEARKRYEFILLMVTVQIFKITDLCLRKFSSQENAEK